MNMAEETSCRPSVFPARFLTLMLLKPEDIVWASGGKVSPVHRQIIGDRERLGRRIPQLGAGCHLPVSPCFELTFLVYRVSCKSSPPLCCCCCKLVYRKGVERLGVITGKESLFRSMKRTSNLTLYVFELSFFCSQPDLGFLQSEMQLCSRGRMVCLMSSLRPDQVFLFETWGRHRSEVPWE